MTAVCNHPFNRPLAGRGAMGAALLSGRPSAINWASLNCVMYTSNSSCPLQLHPACSRHSTLVSPVRYCLTKRVDAARQGATEDELLDPEAVLGVSPAGLRACGLSERKASYILDLAGRFASGALSTERITRMDDAALFAELSAIKGIGAPAGPRSFGGAAQPRRAALRMRAACRRLACALACHSECVVWHSEISVN